MSMRVNELCERVACEKAVCKRVVCGRVAVTELRVRKLAYFFPLWVKVGFPSDAVESRTGRSAIIRMRIDRPVSLCVPSKAH